MSRSERAATDGANSLSSWGTRRAIALTMVAVGQLMSCGMAEDRGGQPIGDFAAPASSPHPKPRGSESAIAAPAELKQAAPVSSPSVEPVAVMRKLGIFIATKAGIAEVGRDGRPRRQLVNRPAVGARRFHTRDSIVYLTPNGKTLELREVGIDGKNDRAVAVLPDTVDIPGQSPTPTFPVYPTQHPPPPLDQVEVEHTRVDERASVYCVLLHGGFYRDRRGAEQDGSELAIHLDNGNVVVTRTNFSRSQRSGCSPEATLGTASARAPEYQLHGEFLERHGDEATRRHVSGMARLIPNDSSFDGTYLSFTASPLMGPSAVSSYLYVLNRRTGEIWGTTEVGTIIAEKVFDSKALVLDEWATSHFVDGDVLATGDVIVLPNYRRKAINVGGIVIY
jgi:hypothetical protein